MKKKMPAGLGSRSGAREAARETAQAPLPSRLRIEARPGARSPGGLSAGSGDELDRPHDFEADFPPCAILYSYSGCMRRGGKDPYHSSQP